MSAIRKEFARVAPEVVREAAKFPPAILADVAGRRGTMHGRISPVTPAMKMAGPAFTVEVRAGDNLMIHTAIALAKPGDVIVVDGKADLTCALIGGLMVNTCKVAQLGGIVIDGAVRDVAELAELGFPVFCAGANPNGPQKLAPGRINWPISCGGLAINPGDLVVGDADGVVVVEREQAAALIPLAAKKAADEQARMAEILAHGIKPKWLDGTLRAAGLLREGESL